MKDCWWCLGANGDTHGCGGGSSWTASTVAALPHRGNSSHSWSREVAEDGYFLATGEMLNADTCAKSVSYTFLL
jgi:hypothetical protein